MITLYAPVTYEPRLVPDMEVKGFLQRGYRRQNPSRSTASVALPSIASPNDEDSKRVNVNTASLKDLAALPGSSMMLANLIKSSRPYKVVEDLFEATNEIDWLAIESKLTF